MKLSPNYRIVEVAGEYMAIPVGPEAVSFHGIIALSEPAAFLLKKMDVYRTKDDLKNLLIEKYDVEESVAVADIDRVVKELIDARVIDE